MTGRAEQATDSSMEEILASIRKIIAEDNPEPPTKAGPQLAVVPDPVASDRVEPDPATTDPRDEMALEIGPIGADLGAADADEPVSDLVAEVVAALHEAPADPAPTSFDSARAAGSGDAPVVDPAASADLAEATDGRSDEEVDSSGDPVMANAEIESSPVGTSGPNEETAPAAGNAPDRLLSAHANDAVQSAFDQLAHTILGQQSRTLEDLVQEMLRPMLRNWLDDNLPVLVERLVREEIERVSRGRR